MQGNWSSFQVDLHYTKLFHIPAVTSVSFFNCEGLLGNSVVPTSKSRLLMCLIGNKALLGMQCRRMGPHLPGIGKFHGFPRVAAEPGVHSPLMAGVVFSNYCFFSDVRTPL